MQSDAFAIQYGPDHGTIAQLPILWDRVYLARWFTFVPWGQTGGQSSDLHAGHARVEAPDYTDFINGYSGRVITGAEMRGGSTGPGLSEIMATAGNPPLALRRSIDKGMAPNAAGRHVEYLEIYEGDVLSPDMQPVLQYAESLFRR